ncbi:MAG: hypothetical protein GX945_09335 [Lentisphaerae bacterium]|nr:hypothetical protein [Lentisphaerota bacterium]
MNRVLCHVLVLLLPCAALLRAQPVQQPAAAPPVQPKVATETMRSKELQVKAWSAARARNVALYAANCASLVDDFLHCSDQPKSMLYISERGLSGAENRSYTLEFTADERMDAVTWRLMQVLLRRRAREMGYKVPVDAAVLRWLASALTNRMVMGGRGVRGIYELDYQVANQQFARKHFPRVDELLLSRLSPDYSELFQLHMLHCDLLVGCFERLPAPHGQIFCELLELAAHGRPLVQAASYVLQNYQPGVVSLQAWYERQVLLVCDRGIRHQSLAMIIECVEVLESVQMVKAGRGLDLVERVHLDEVPDVIKDLKLDRNAIGHLQLCFYELKRDAPVLLQPALDMYGEALATLANGHTTRFRREFRAAREEFARAVDRQQRVAAVLDEAEREYVTVPDRFGVYLRVQERYDELRDQLLPVWQDADSRQKKDAVAPVVP